MLRFTVWWRFSQNGPRSSKFEQSSLYFNYSDWRTVKPTLSNQKVFTIPTTDQQAFLSQRGRAQYPPRRHQKYQNQKELHCLKQKVNTFIAFTKNTLIPYLKKKVHSFQAGQISQFCREWEKLTTDPDILAIVSGTQISFNGMCPVQHQSPPNSLSRGAADQIKDAIQQSLDKQVIVPCVSDPIEFVSPIFTTPKKDGNIRLILNIKKTQRISKKLSFQNG